MRKGELVLAGGILFALFAPAEAVCPGGTVRGVGGYTNHAGHVMAGWPIALTAHGVTLAESNGAVRATYPLSIFPEAEQRRMAADFGAPRLPVHVRRALEGVARAMARAHTRAEKGLCTKEECAEFCAKSETAIASYLDSQVKAGVITPDERKAVKAQLP